jgi:hypothetical protein
LNPSRPKARTEKPLLLAFSCPTFGLTNLAKAKWPSKENSNKKEFSARSLAEAFSENQLSACRSQGLGAGRSKRAVLTHHTRFGYPLRLLFYGSTHPTSWVGSLSVKRGKKKSNFKKLFNLN